MKKFLVLVCFLMLTGVAIASVNVQSNGTSIGPAQDINFTNGTVSGNGPVKTVDLATITDDMVVTGSITADGTIYTGKVIADGGVKLGSATSDPCATLGAGYLFINATTGAPCFCNSLNVDLSLYNGTTACF